MLQCQPLTCAIQVRSCLCFCVPDYVSKNNPQISFQLSSVCTRMNSGESHDNILWHQVLPVSACSSIIPGVDRSSPGAVRRLGHQMPWEFFSVPEVHRAPLYSVTQLLGSWGYRNRESWLLAMGTKRAAGLPVWEADHGYSLPSLSVHCYLSQPSKKRISEGLQVARNIWFL